MDKSGRPPGAYGAAAGHRPLLQATERFRTGRPEIRRRRAVRLYSPRPALGPRCAAVRLPTVSHPAAAGRRQGVGSYRSHPWRLDSGGKPPSNNEHRINDLRLAICVLLLQTLKAKPLCGFAVPRGDRRAPRAARRHRRWLRSLRRQTAGLPEPRNKTKGAGAAPEARAGRRKKH